MSIKFICTCGKHLRARDEMAARRARCPRCGAPVGIPSMRPTHAGTLAAPMTPYERQRLHGGTSSDVTLTPNATTAITAELPPPAPPPRRTPKVRRRRQLEQHWYQCLAYPFLNWFSLLQLSFLSSIWMAGMVLSIPTLPRFSEMSLQVGLSWASALLVLMLIVGYAYATVECALTSALAGEGSGSYRPGWRAGFPLKSGLRWLFCFLAGPIASAGLAVYFWFYGGDLTALDWAIVAELGVLTIAYWLLAIVSVNERNRLRDVSPPHVIQLLHRLSYRAVVPVLIAPALLLAHGLLGLFALIVLHRQVFGGWLLLAICLGSALFWSAFVFRLLGVWCYRSPPVGVGP